MKMTFANRTLGGGAPTLPSSAVDPLGPMSAALENARTQLASCAAYQAFLGVSTSQAAVAKTYLAALPPPDDKNEYTREQWESTLRPFGMVYTSSAGGYSATRSALYAVRENGRLFIELEITIPMAYQPGGDAPAIDLTTDLEAADRWMLNQLGQIIAEFMALSGQPGYLDVSSVTVMMGPSRERHEEPLAQGCYYWTLLEVIWGPAE